VVGGTTRDYLACLDRLTKSTRGGGEAKREDCALNVPKEGENRAAPKKAPDAKKEALRQSAGRQKAKSKASSAILLGKTLGGELRKRPGDMEPTRLPGRIGLEK